MDDIKLYAKSEPDIDSLIHTTGIYSWDDGLSFWLDGVKEREGNANRGDHPPRKQNSKYRREIQVPWNTAGIASSEKSAQW